MTQKHEAQREREAAQRRVWKVLDEAGQGKPRPVRRVLARTQLEFSEKIGRVDAARQVTGNPSS